MAKTASATKPKPRLKNLDDLFQLNGGINPLDQPAPPIEALPASKRVVSMVSIDRLSPFPGHPFRLYEGERLEDMVVSIRANGVLVPIIVRHMAQGFEILAGHNRVNAAKLAGQETVPAVILENVTDAEAWIYVVETNLMQRSFSDMSYTEKAAVITTQHSKLFSQGKRNDILSELRALENQQVVSEDTTLRQPGAMFHSDELVGTIYSLSSRAVSRYIRIHQLIPELKARLDNGGFAFLSAVTLSFLKEAEQSALDRCLEKSDLVVDMKKADILRQYSAKGKLDSDSILSVLTGIVGRKPPPNRTPTVKINKTVYARYFQPAQTAKEIQGIVEKALELYFSAK